MRKTPVRLIGSCLCASIWLACSLGCTPWRDYVRNRFKVGPEYAEPPTPVACDWIDSNDQRLQGEADDLSYWWGVFNDPALDGLVGDAARQNLTLREAGCRILQARAARAIAAGSLFPQKQDLTASYTRGTFSRSFIGIPFLPRYFDIWYSGFNLSWELDFWGRYRRAVAAADADLEASVAAYDQVMVTLLGDVAATYVEIRTLERRVELAQRNVELQRETYTIARARFRGGQVSELDADQAASVLAQTEARIPQLRMQIRQANNRLCVLLGMPAEDLKPMLGSGPIPVAPAQAVVGIPADLLRRRPDVRRAEREVASQSEEVGIATAQLYPHIGINGSLGLLSRDLSDLFQNDSMIGGIGPLFQWNILNYGRLLNNIRQQDAGLAERIVAYQQTVLRASAEVENGLARFLNAQERTRHLADSVEAAERAAKAVLAQYRTGLTDFNRVSLVEQNLVQQQDLLCQSQGEIALGLVEVYRALGGGWRTRFDRMPGLEELAEPGPEEPQVPRLEEMSPDELSPEELASEELELPTPEAPAPEAPGPQLDQPDPPEPQPRAEIIPSPEP